MRKQKTELVLLLLVAAVVSFAGNAFGQAVQEQTFTRIISYDPHPSSATFAEPVPHGGELLQYEAGFKETWKTNQDEAFLKQISFTIQALKGNTPVASASTAAFLLDKVSKGQQIGATSLGNTSFTATAESFVRKSGGITDLTVVFKISYAQSTLEKVEQKEANRQNAGAFNLCRRFAMSADAMPNKNVQTKIRMYRKALMTAPAPEVSAEAESFHLQINEKIAKLENASGEQSAVGNIGQNSYDTTSSTSAQSAAAVTEPISAEAETLLKQAKTFFAQEKGPEGREALRKALEIAPDYYEALILLGDNAYANRKFARAKEAFDKALNKRDNDAATILKYFKSCYYLGEGSEAILKAAELKNRYPDDNAIKLSLVESYFQLGDLPSAQAECIEILAKEPSNYRAKELLQRINRLKK